MTDLIISTISHCISINQQKIHTLRGAYKFKKDGKLCVRSDVTCSLSYKLIHQEPD